MRIFILALVFYASTATAQVAEFAICGGQSLLSGSGIGTTSQTGGNQDDLKLTNGFRLGFRLTLNTKKFLGHEFGYAYNRTKFRLQGTPPQDYGTSIHQGFYDFLIYGVPEGKKIRPFLAGGGQFSNFIYPGLSVTEGGGSTKFGVNYGAGLKVRVSQMFMIRFDVRQYMTPKPFDFPLKQGWMRQNEISAGFGLVL